MVKAWKKSLWKKPLVQNRAQKLWQYCMKPEQHILQKNPDCKKMSFTEQSCAIRTWHFNFLFCFQGVWSNYS